MGADEEVVARQIGRPPRGRVRVAARCAWGYPTVVAVDPLLEGRRAGAPPEPFPTRWWLTCPALSGDIARLESEGLIARLEEEIAADPALDAAVAEDHRRYAAARFAALERPQREEAARRGMLEILRDSGVGGARDRGHLKCLHAHFAHHIADRNVVGALLAARHSPRECPAGEVRCDAYRVPGTGFASRPPATARRASGFRPASE